VAAVSEHPHETYIPGCARCQLGLEETDRVTILSRDLGRLEAERDGARRGQDRLTGSLAEIVAEMPARLSSATLPVQIRDMKKRLAELERECESRRQEALLAKVKAASTENRAARLQAAVAEYVLCAHTWANSPRPLLVHEELGIPFFRDSPELAARDKAFTDLHDELNSGS